MRFAWHGVLAAIGSVAICGAASSQTTVEGLLRGTVECDVAAAEAKACRVDLSTYLGWRVFNAHCASCHAADALGSRFAPDLTLRMQAMTARQFFAALDNGYLGRTDMPPRGRDPDVARYYDELWTYLRARVTGELPPGPLALVPDHARELAD